MKESVTYQAIVDDGVAKGVIKGAQELLLRQGRKKFGAPDVQAERALRGITDADRLNYLSERLLDVSSWSELLAMP